MPPSASFLSNLQKSASDAAGAEDAFRREIAVRTKALESQRIIAHRRLNFMQAVTDAIAQTDSADVAVAVAAAVLRNRFGWNDDSDARSEVIAQFVPVAQAVFAALETERLEGESLEGEEIPDVLAALQAFEDWYAASRGSSFWALFDVYIPETPRTDF